MSELSQAALEAISVLNNCYFTVAGGCERAEVINAIEKLEAALAQHKNNGWQPIETAPKDGTYILLAESKTKEVFEGSYFGGFWFNSGGDCVYATHWMPLPAPPETDK